MSMKPFDRLLASIFPGDPKFKVGDMVQIDIPIKELGPPDTEAFVELSKLNGIIGTITKGPEPWMPSGGGPTWIYMMDRECPRCRPAHMIGMLQEFLKLIKGGGLTLDPEPPGEELPTKSVIATKRTQSA